MGGNALKTIKTVRKNKEEYTKIKEYILDTLKNENLVFDVPFEVPNKESFGDLDVLYQSNDKINIKDIVIKLFKPDETVGNGDLLSFNYTDFQIDMIKCKNINTLPSIN